MTVNCWDDCELLIPFHGFLQHVCVVMRYRNYSTTSWDCSGLILTLGTTMTHAVVNFAADYLKAVHVISWTFIVFHLLFSCKTYGKQ